MSARSPRRRDGGFVTVQFVAAVALSLVLFVLLANLLIWSYGRGVVRAALDDGVRAGARAVDVRGVCQARAEAVLDDLLGGAMGDGLGRVRCTLAGTRVEAEVAGTFPAWLPVLPDWSFELAATASKERIP